ncbi:lipoprotein localization protein LolB [Affinibrenneria salicis]|uniref:Outer-membrane lipoprotein LolB n=1 Tax=Affinibrenneria salicis TaxID=2590031 RepID=A0A5J5G4D5_9GAMM|nr:lipoprotein insertase outer membrane protein LolB [Affinibrenneria salicis]KAA9001908.1 lipoprotein localization protein LolB [Affinibrenneria salicis]
MSINFARSLRLLPLAAFLLTACTLTQPESPGQSPSSPEWKNHQQQVQKLTRYQIRGAFAYLSDSKKLSARFFWQQSSPQHYRLMLINPLGSTELELRVQPDGVQVIDNQGKRYNGDDAQQMLLQLTGMSIPLQNLRQWMIGLPGDATHYALDDSYRLKSLNYRHDGQSWDVVYQSYSQSVTPSLPQNIELTQDGQRIKLKMDNWTLN